MEYGKRILLAIIALLLLSFTLISVINHPIHKSKQQFTKLEKPQEPWLEAIIPDGGSIFSVMEHLNIPTGEIASFSYNIGEYIDVTTIQPGDTLRVLMSPDQTKIVKAMYVQEPTIRHHFIVQNDTLVYTLESLPVKEQIRIVEGVLNKTLDASLLAYGFDSSEKQQINNALEGDINFQRDARNGDKFRILLEERIFQGKKLPRGKILYTSYSGQRTGQHELFRYEEGDDKSVMNGLYNKEGKSNSTSGVGFPLSSIHVISAFGNRIHPIFRRWMFHQGVDYRAGYGTPVYAVANGSVIEAAYSGGWGNVVRIKHPSGMITLSAHLASIGVRNRQTVKKGQVIGRVGSTGQSTGAHLHFGLMQGKAWINPTKLKMVGAERLNGTQMVNFKQQQSKILALIQSTENNPQKLLVKR